MAYNEYDSSDESPKDDNIDLYLNPNGKNEPKSILDAFADDLNIADKLTDDQLAHIGQRVLYSAQDDKATQVKWLENAKEALRLAKLEREPKNTPLPQSSNVKLPLITNACYQYAALTYPELIQDGKVVKGEVIGEDPDGSLSDMAETISTHMSYQLLGVDGSWSASMDKLLVLLACIGFVVKKTYYDPITQKNVSLVCNFQDVILRNDDCISCIADLRRITHVIYMHPNDLVEGCRYGIYNEEAVDQILARYSEAVINPIVTLYEQHCWYDLDEDGYEEPYIVTVDMHTGLVIRIVARFDEEGIERTKAGKVKCITPIQYFTDFHFLPSPDGTFMSMGYGLLLLHLNSASNTIMNQLIDSGSLANMQGGFIDSRIKFMGGQRPSDQGSWIMTKGVPSQLLKDGFMPHLYKEPSSVLFQLLGMLIQTSKELTSTTEALQGNGEGQNTPAATSNNMLSQSMKPFIAIQHRMYRSLDAEYRKLFALNAKYLQPEEIIKVVGQNVSVSKDMYQTDNIRVIPVADPNLSSDGQRLSKLSYIVNLLQNPAIVQHINVANVLQQGFKWINLPNPGSFLQAPPPPAPDPNLLKVQAKAQNDQANVQIKSRHQALKEKEFAAKLPKTAAEIHQIQANSIKLVAQADKTQHDAKMDEHGASLATLQAKLDAMHQAHKQMMDAAVQNHQLHQDKQQQGHDQVMDLIGAHQAQQSIDQNQEAQDNAQEDGNNSVAPPSGD